MPEHAIYKDIAERTDGEIYVGVVGPVRTGKSTFIKKFIEELVVPNIENQYDLERTKDEMPQSGSGKTVMTTEPKFIPDNAVNISLADKVNMKVKLIDCVGYIVPDAMGQTENGEPRMVMTPWSEKPMPFKEAAEIGTKKVISDHATIGIVVTTDGTIGDIQRESYIEAEERVINELKAEGKPFAIILNSAKPENEETINLAYELENKYGVSVALVNCLMLDEKDINSIMAMILEEFPIKEINIEFPKWTCTLDNKHWLIQSLYDSVFKSAMEAEKIKDIKSITDSIKQNQYVEVINKEEINMGNGTSNIAIGLLPELYYKVMSELTGFDIDGEDSLIKLMKELSEVKNKYDKISDALDEVNEKGYGIVCPQIDELTLEEPEVIKQPGGYGVKIRAKAPSIHMIKADIETEINPIIGSEQQSEDLINYLQREIEDEPMKVWESNLFGKTLHELVNEGLNEKLSHMPDDARLKLSETLGRVINEGSGGLICIIL